MANSLRNPDSKLRRVEQPPRMLKDFLADDDSNKAPSRLLRSPSKAASTTISAIHKASEIVVNAVKFLPFTSVKSQSILPRSISRRLSKRGKHENDDVQEVSLITVKVKDILRWRSFRDLAEEKPPQLDFSSSPHLCTTTTTTTGSTGTTTTSGRSSWSDSDFNSEDLPFWCGNFDEYRCEHEAREGKKSLPGSCVGGDSKVATTRLMVTPKKGELPCEDEKEQNSPVSVLDFSFKQDEQFSVEESTDIEEAANGEEEEKAKQLLNHVRATSTVDHLLFDFFMHELSIKSRKKLMGRDEFDCETLIKVAEAWMSGDDNGLLGWEMKGNREVCVRDMDRGERWNKFEEEEGEIALEIETHVLTYMVDELLNDLVITQ